MQAVPRDVGLTLFQSSLGSLDCESPKISCGKLLLCGPTNSCNHDELRRPRTIVKLVSGVNSDADACLHDSSKDSARVIEVRSPLVAESLAKQTCILKQTLCSVLRSLQQDVECPILLQSQAHYDHSAALAMALLLIIGVPLEAVVAVCRIISPDSAGDIVEAVAELKPELTEAVMPDSDCSVDLDVVRGLLHDSPEEGPGNEVAWLKQDMKLIHKFAQTAETDVTSVWCDQLAIAGERLSQLSCPKDAAAALYLRGWALIRVGRLADAREALDLGALLAGGGRGKRELVERLLGENASIPANVGLSGRLVVEPTDASKAMDPNRCAFVLDFGDPATGATQVCGQGWQLLALPKRFSWVIYSPPALFAACDVEPDDNQLRALKAVGLTNMIRADGPPGSADRPVDSVVNEIAESLKDGKGCLIYSNASAKSGIAIACFICRYGFGYPHDWDPDHCAHSADEAVEIIKGLRGESALGGSSGDEAVRFFQQSVWAEIMMGRVRKRTAPSQPEEAQRQVGARVVAQPGDGNCLFHSLAYGLGGEKASSLRKKICDYMKANPDLDISGTSLEDWVTMSAQSSVTDYVKRMQRSGEWGGGPEIAVCARMKDVDIHVYEDNGGGMFELVAPFCGRADGSACGKIVSVVYVGRMHYDALVL